MELNTLHILNVLECIILIPFLFELNQVMLKWFKKKYSIISEKRLNILFFYHLLFGLIYYVYAFFNPSDSKGYFRRAYNFEENWLQLFGTETTFIDFISYPFINFFYSFKRTFN